MGKYLWTLAILILAALSAFSLSSHAAGCGNGDRTSANGTVYRRDSTRPALGCAFRDPHGLIWGAAVLVREGGKLRPMKASTAKAMAYCRKAGGRLPKPEEFLRLAEDLGGNSYDFVSQEGPAMLEGLENWLMTAPDNSENFEDEVQHYFIGPEGYLVSGGEARGDESAVGPFLCVAN